MLHGMKLMKRIVSAKGAAVLAILGLAVVLLDAYAALRWPAIDMGGVVAKMMLFALAVIELGPAIGFTGLALWARSRQLSRRDKMIFVCVTPILLPISAFGAWVALEVLAQWGDAEAL